MAGINDLSEKEQNIVLQILNQLIKDGKSDVLDSLMDADWKEKPVDIITFLTDDYYLGKAWKTAEGKSKLFPFWKKKFLEIFPDEYTTRYNNLILSGARGLGKAQPLDSLVLTTSGYKKMRDMKVGERVFGCDGKPHEVIGVFPQGVKPTCKVSFTDGTSTLCCDEHLWVVSSRRNHVNNKVVTTKELIGKCLTNTRTYRGSSTKEHYYNIPICSPIEFEHKDVVVSPYVLGVLLGDGTLTGGRVAFSNWDEEVINNVQNELPSDLILHRDDKNHYYSIRKAPNEKHNRYNIYLTQENLHTRAENKHIPQEYLYNDISTRLSLLQGLLDTDGYISKDGSNISFSTASQQLANDIQFLVQSLGGMCHLHTKSTSYTNKKTSERVPCKTSYIVYIKLPKDLMPFRLTRRLDRLNPKRNCPTRYIDKIEYVEPMECQCILVDSDEHLYLTNDFIVTHNTEVFVACAEYLMHRIMCMRDPLNYYGLKPSEKICFAFMNITKDLAEDIAKSKFQNSIQMSPWFLERGRLAGRDYIEYIPPEPIQIIIGSQSRHVIGLPIYFAAMDEISFIPNQDIEKQKQKALDMVDTALGGMKTRFTNHGKNPTLMVLASSKRSEKSFLETHMKQKAETEPDKTMIVDEPTWNVRPKEEFCGEKFKVALGNKFLVSEVISDESKVEEYRAKGYTILDVPIEYKSKFLEEIDRALCDYAGVSSSELSTYISGARWQECKLETLVNPFVKDVLEIGNALDDKEQYFDYFDLSRVPQEMKAKPLYIHLDLSLTGDKTGIGGVWQKGRQANTAEVSAKDFIYQVAFSVAIKAPHGHQVSFEKTRNFIYWLKEQGFNIKGISSDTFQSANIAQTLSAKGYDYTIISVDRVEGEQGSAVKICKPYEFFKNCIYERRIIVYQKCDLLTQEIVQLERNGNTGKIDHPSNGSKDTVDAICGSLWNASQHSEEFSYEFGDDIETTLSVNQDENTLEQYNMNFEEELKKLFNPSSTPNSTTTDVYRQNAPQTLPASAFGIIL